MRGAMTSATRRKLCGPSALDSVGSLAAYGGIFFRNVKASGVIPQISVILGPCAGGAVYSPAMTDFIFIVNGTSHMFITGPDVVKTVTGEEVTQEELGGAMTHATKSGVATFVAPDEQACLEQVRYLLSFLPSNNLEEPPRIETGDASKWAYAADNTQLIFVLRPVVGAKPTKPSTANAATVLR